MSIGHRPRKDATHVRDEGDGRSSDSFRRLPRRHHPRRRMIQYYVPYRFYRETLEYWMPAFAGMTAGVPLPLPLSPHENQIGAFVGLQNGLVEQMRVTAFGPFRRRDRRQRRASLFKF